MRGIRSSVSSWASHQRELSAVAYIDHEARSDDRRELCLIIWESNEQETRSEPSPRKLTDCECWQPKQTRPSARGCGIPENASQNDSSLIFALNSVLVPSD